jgi:hypothetical protein
MPKVNEAAMEAKKAAEEQAQRDHAIAEIIRKQAKVVAMERGPGSLERVYSRTLDGIRLEVAIGVYVEMIGQVSRQNRNVEQAATEMSAKAFKCADEFVKSLPSDSSAS